MAWIVSRERPDVVISTGAASGYFALLFGHLFWERGQYGSTASQTLNDFHSREGLLENMRISG